MKDIMLDLETLGTSPGSVILSIGAVAFDPKTGELGESFYQVINTYSCVMSQLTVDGPTFLWWSTQAPEAQVVLSEAEQGGMALPLALESFGHYLDDFGKGVKVWGNGSDFDQPILAAAYKTTSQPLPWKFYNNRCYRTLKNLAPHTKIIRVGTYHNALDDAKSQALHACQIFEFMARLKEDQSSNTESILGTK